MFRFLATLTASAINSFKPVPFKAEVSIIGQPKTIDKRLVSIFKPLFQLNLPYLKQ